MRFQWFHSSHIQLLTKRNFFVTTTKFDKSDVDRLKGYKDKRNFNRTNEPKPTIVDNENSNQNRFVVQEHHASLLHYDFRLEYRGVLKRSIPKGPSLNPKHRRLAIMVEDHPISYFNFEGKIPDGEYGAGEVRIWDRGYYNLVGDMETIIESGKLNFTLNGTKLKGAFQLIWINFQRQRDKNRWLLIKIKDQYADENFIIEHILQYGSRKYSPTKKIE